jgi:anti-sigma-K factor RskA
MTPDQSTAPPDPDTPEHAAADVQAAEYVLGTLDRSEREAAQALIASDPAFAALVNAWERRLGELHALAGDVDPPAAVWDAVKARLPEVAQTAPLRLPELSNPPPSPPAPPANVIDLNRRMVRWRTLAATAGTMAAVLGLIIITSAVAPTVLPDSLRPRPRVIVQMTEGTAVPPPARFVAVLQRDAASPAFIVTVDIANRSLTVRRVAAEQESGKSYELWLVSNKFPAPRSLGLVSGGEFTQSGNLAAYDPSVISDATFAVSLEPEGGSPTGAPSNVMFLGKLIESTPPVPRSPEAH